ncbi:glycosyltransferase 87 family protein [Solwaraspora sp. WMMD1047]|uniref:glycosyltransferase 87 family protein n=1 Tax=Solwaraspora sp. WMMD1047 TaxID=3016102 RepID=UPI0024160219|nr:glycosyltransferase 87 family protein [Solwaraspora sp. WMMD1047]MDG4831173.1 glycosyltransferase 87 family protein [Solwaraspora sp. WMMD1047]
MAGRRAGLIWLLYGITAAVSVALVLRRPSWDRLSDLHIYHGAVRHLRSGSPLYSYVADNGGPFTYPPFAAVILWPIGALPEPVVQAGWLAATCAAVVAIAVALGGVLAVAGPRRQLVIAAVACALLVSAPVQSNLRFGQVSIFIVLLALVDGMGLTPARYRGLLVGMAAAIKLTPLLFVGYFLLARRYRDAARAGAAFVGCAVVGAAVLPGDSLTFWSGTIVNTSRIGNLASLGNQSLHGMLLRVGVDGNTLPVLWAALVVVVCGVALLRARALESAGQPAYAAVLVGCATVAASPVSWTHHQVWPVLAAMLLIGTRGVARRAAGFALLTVLVLSLGALLSQVSRTTGLQFLFENARALAAIAICLAGFGAVAVTAGRRAPARRGGLRVAAVAAVTLAFFAVQPLPAGADPTFKAYAMSDVDNPRYFFVCRTRADCAAFAAGAPIRIGTAAERTKVRVNGVVDATIARLEYQSAPGGAARVIPLLPVYPGQRAFSFRSANLSHGRLVAYDAAGTPVATYTEELAAR